jgi:pyruvate, water dikinase
MKDSILYFDEIGLQDVAKVGNKNASLGEVFKHFGAKGILVPDGFATTIKVYREFLKQNNLEQKIAHIINGLDEKGFSNLPEIGSTVRSLLQNSVFPYYTQVQILAAYSELVERVENDRYVVVRSSAIAKDFPKATFAKQLDSYPNVEGEDALLEACKNCFVSLFTDKALQYCIHRKINPIDVALSVGVQQMIHTNMDDSVPVSFTLNKAEQKMISKWSALIEDHFHMPLKIEWGRDEMNGKLYLIQVSGELIPPLRS